MTDLVLAEVAAALAPHGLGVTGGFHPEPEDGAPEGTGTLLLVGADGAAMWKRFRASPEMTDGAPHPLDRWSERVLGGVAEGLGAEALFPFGGPPYRPFTRWAPRAEGARSSPLGVFVTPERGLWASWRGALGFGARLGLGGLAAAPFPDPCAGCPAPCITACPVGAFEGGRYDVPRCVGHAGAPKGRECRERGCLARHACPVGAPLPEAQAAFHLAAFLRGHGGTGAQADGPD